MYEKIYKILDELENENQIFTKSHFANELFICIFNVSSVDTLNKKIKCKTNFSSKFDELFGVLFLNSKAIKNENRYTIFTLKNDLMVTVTYESYNYENYDIITEI